MVYGQFALAMYSLQIHILIHLMFQMLTFWALVFCDWFFDFQGPGSFSTPLFLVIISSFLGFFSLLVFYDCHLEVLEVLFHVVDLKNHFIVSAIVLRSTSSNFSWILLLELYFILFMIHWLGFLPNSPITSSVFQNFCLVLTNDSHYSFFVFCSTSSHFIMFILIYQSFLFTS